MNKQLDRNDLYSLEKYAEVRNDFRAKVIGHKKNRQVAIGPNATLYFEDALTMQYQIQEMLRIERIFEAEGIQEELDAYNPLIPDGSNWKATFMLEYPDEDERRMQLQKLVDIEKHIWAQVADFARVTPVADEDLERTDEDKTSSVHFLRFELTAEMVQAVKAGAAISMGIDHPEYTYAVEPLAQNTRDSLAADLA
jgi:hypothetical protein